MASKRGLSLIEKPEIKGISWNALLSMYKIMVCIREFEESVGDLIDMDEIMCPCHLYIGQEAIAVGVCSALKKTDYVFSTHRSHGHYIAKGGDLNALMAELYCRTTGCSKGKGGSMHLISPDVGLPGSSAIVAGTIPLSVGAALSFSIQGKDSISAAFFGDGATNEGAFYESLNFASLKKLPVIFVCENNLFSTHMPISDCLADTNIAKKADAFGMQGIKIDGNDVLEVHKAAIKAISKARCGGGPTLIECMTYRWRGHVGPNYDLDKGLRNQDELDRWMRRCPIKILENALMDSGFFSEKDKKNIHDEIDVRIKNAISFARESPHPDPDNIEALKGTFKR